MDFDKRRRPASPLTPNQNNSYTSLIHKFTPTIPGRMTKRSKIPPPLQLDPLTPPPTLRRPIHPTQRLNSSPLNNEVDLEGFTMSIGSFNSSSTSLMMSLDSPTPFQQPKAKSNFVKEMCCICEEPITTKLTNERTWGLDCDHKCHHNCYLVLLNKDDMNDITICSLCGVKTRPTDEDIFQDLYSQTLIHDDTQTPIIESGLLSPVVVSAFKTNFFEETSTPYTPQNQMTNNLNSCGFSPVDKKNVTTTISTQSSIFTLRSSTPRCSTDDLIEPHVSIVSEFAKHSINDNLKSYRSTHLLNIYTNEVLSAHVTESSQKDNELKFKIHDKVISHITSTIRDSKGVSFSKLPYLRMFDCFDISLDGSVWEYVYAFIFDETLILMNEELDSVIGTVLLGEHYTSCYKIDNTTLVIYFSSASLPELQIHSQNKILLDKWVEFFEYKLRQKQMVPLVQMTTNTWDLIDDGSIELPSEIIKFNDLTSRGLDLPLQVMKSVMTIPKRLPCVVIACVPVYNDTTLDDEVYSRQIKNVLRLTLDQLEQCDKFGLVLMGRSGQNKLDELETTYFGITSADWSQWDDIIDDLRVYKGSKKNMGSKMDSMIKSINKLCMFWPVLEKRQTVKKLMMIRTGGVEEGDGNFDFKSVLMKGFSIHDILISETYDEFSDKLVSSLVQVDGMRQYHLRRFDDFTSFQNSISSLIHKFKSVLISSLDIEMDIELSSYVSFGDDEDYNSDDHWQLKLKDLEDGHYTNTSFDIIIDIEKLLKNYGLVKNEFHDIPILKYKYTIDGDKYHEGNFSMKLCVNEGVNSMSPLDASSTSNDTKEEKTFIDIPLLPPLSSFKDSLFVKKQVESLVIETLSKHGSIHELVTWIFGLIRGCSTTHIDFFKNSSFNKYKNFSCYVEELVKMLNKIKSDETKRRDLVYKLSIEEELEWF